ncbi:hypothetical protein BDV41DRAFT_536747 [Aspergillus transmontanensis]|uniref:Uncharacterized protein n=1 Tax=Aspergillus transmontanensis TaxID=1034304 RepID=A0A5N6VY68_9EURO|nr:hypothetical protein BDV41DRAFT_536747 [Aspergillus transmontanensis]
MAKRLGSSDTVVGSRPILAFRIVYHFSMPLPHVFYSPWGGNAGGGPSIMLSRFLSHAQYLFNGNIGIV